MHSRRHRQLDPAEASKKQLIEFVRGLTQGCSRGEFGALLAILDLTPEQCRIWIAFADVINVGDAGWVP